MTEADAMSHAQQSFSELLLRDVGGVIWVGAELVILYLVLLAQRVTAELPRAGRLELGAEERARAWRWSLAWFGLVGVTFGRHLILPPLASVLPTATDATVGAEYLLRAQVNTGVWLFYILIWVLLEPAIVWYGIRVFAKFRNQIVLATLLLCGIAGSAHALSPAVEAAYWAAHDQAEWYRRLQQASLRGAGCVWIAVEWVAAVIILRTYLILRKRLARG